jgi:hypothetical protein
MKIVLLILSLVFSVALFGCDKKAVELNNQSQAGCQRQQNGEIVRSFLSGAVDYLADAVGVAIVG